jgi:DNA-binding transcriptional regulator YiaG
MEAATNGILSESMNMLRELRRAISVEQREFAALPSIPLETYRPWDSGRRVVPAAVLQRARVATAVTSSNSNTSTFACPGRPQTPAGTIG